MVLDIETILSSVLLELRTNGKIHPHLKNMGIFPIEIARSMD